MTKCPDVPTIENCAIEAAQNLVDNGLVVVDHTAYLAGESGFYIQKEGALALDVFSVREIKANGMTDIAVLGCMSCGRCVELVDDTDELSVRFGEFKW